MAWGFTKVDADSITLMSHDIAGDGTGNFVFQINNDAPEGGLRLFNNPAAESLIVTLPINLTLGISYHAFIYAISYDQFSFVKITCGGNDSNTDTLDDRDVNNYVSNKLSFVAGANTNQITITFTRNGTFENRLIFRGLYITTNINVTLTRDLRAVELIVPPTEDNEAIKGNLIPNSGFKAGIDATWGLDSGRFIDHSTLWLNTGVGRNGGACIRFSCDPANGIGGVTTFSSKVFRLKPNRKYTVTGYMKADVAVNGTLILRNTFLPPAGYPAQWFFGTGIAITTSWQRFSITGYAKKYPDNDYYIEITANEMGAGQGVYLEDFQLEEGDETPYAPGETLEVILSTSKKGNTFYDTDTLEGTLRAHNTTGAQITKSLNYEIYDYNNALIRSGSQSLTVNANATTTFTFNLTTAGAKGYFRVYYWFTNEPLSERELSYSVLVNYGSVGLDVNSFMGVHGDDSSSHLESLFRLGIRWARSLGIFRWTFAEPTEGNFIYADSFINKQISFGITPLGCLMGGSSPPWPAYADNAGLPNLAKWDTFVQNIVGHYKFTVKHWQIWNEPFHQFTANFYAQMLKLTCDAIEAVSLGDHVIYGWGGCPRTYIDAVVVELNTLYMPGWDWRDHVDVLDTHNYFGGEPPEASKILFDTYGKPVVNSESGLWDFSNHVGPFANFTAPGKAIIPYLSAARFYTTHQDSPHSLVSLFTRGAANHQSGFMYYIASWGDAPNYFQTHFTAYANDEHPKLKLIAYSVAGMFIDKATTFGNVSPNNNTQMLLFEKAGVPVCVIFSTDNAPRTVTLAVSVASFLTYDLLGNFLPQLGSDSSIIISYGREPIYVKSDLSTAAFQAALIAGVINSNTPSEVPYVRIVDCPRDKTYEHNFRVRWFGRSRYSKPALGEANIDSGTPSPEINPDAMLYSYQMPPYLNSYTPWDQNIYVDFTGILDGTYTFFVRAKDEFGNISAEAIRSIQVGDVITQPSGEILMGAKLT